MKISYILVSIYLITFLVGCGGSNSNAELEKEKLKLEREKLELEKSKSAQGETKDEAIEDKSRQEEKSEEVSEAKRKDLAKKASKANEFESGTDAVVAVKKTFFYSMPDDGSKKSSFLIEGDIITVEKRQRNFVKVTYTNEFNGKVTTGWLKSDDLEVIGYGD